MMKSAYWLVPLLLVATAWPSGAVCPPDCPVGGKVKLGTRRIDLQRVTVQTDFAGSQAFPPNGSAADPVLHGATLRVFTEVGDQFDVTFQLPRDHWNYVGQGFGANAGYRYSDLGQIDGLIRLVLVRPGNGTKVKGAGPLGFSLLTNPNPVQAVLTYGGSTQVCGSYGGITKFNPGKGYVAIRAMAPASCPAPPAP